MNKQKKSERERETTTSTRTFPEGVHAYNFMLETVSEATVMAECDGTILYGNRRLAEILGLSQERIIGANLYDFFPQGDREKLEMTFALGRRESDEEVFSLVTGRGEVLPVYVSGTRIKQGSKDALCLVIADMPIGRKTQRQSDPENRAAATPEETAGARGQSGQKADEGEHPGMVPGEGPEYLKMLAESGPGMITVIQEDGLIVYAAGQFFKRTLGRASKACIGKNLFDLVEVGERDRVSERIRALAQTPGQTVSMETIMRDQDGKLHIVEAAATNLLRDPRVAGIVMHGRDITERRQAEEKSRRSYDDVDAKMKERTAELRKALERLDDEIKAHKASEEERVRLAAAIERGGDCVIIMDREGTIHYVNPAFEKVSLYTREELTGRHFDALRAAGEAPAWQDMWETLKSGITWRGRALNSKKDGTVYEVERVVSTIRDKKGQITYYVCAERDPAQEAGLEAELRQAQKMQAIGTLAGGIAHDFNNILAAMIGFTELALDEIPRDGRAARHLAQVSKAGYRGRELVKQILTFSRQGEQEKKPVQVAPIVREVLNLIRASLPSSIDIRSSVETEEGIILADPVQIHQLLINLTTNAGQAMRAGKGTLEVRLSDFALGDEEDAPHPDMMPGQYIRILVSDTGPGIDGLIKDRIFEPFFTTRQQSEGAGMGLSVVYGIVKSHHGVITVSSGEGGGATFAVYFRKLKEAAPVGRAEQAHASKGKRRILFVDDEEALVEIAKQMLERLGYEVVAEKDSVRALKQFRREPERFDLVITDQTMPNMTGIELARQMMSIRKDIPIILCTGFSETISPEAAKAMGIREFVMKPIVRSEMAATISRVISAGVRSDKR